MNYEINLKLLAITIEALNINNYDDDLSAYYKKIYSQNNGISSELKQYHGETIIIKYLFMKYIITHKFNLQILIKQIIQGYITNIHNKLIERYFAKFTYLYHKIFTYYEDHSFLKLNLTELAIYNLYVLYKISEKNKWALVY